MTSAARTRRAWFLFARGRTMNQAKVEENRAAYDDFLVWLDKSMREALKTTAVPSEVDKLQGARADVEPRA